MNVVISQDDSFLLIEAINTRCAQIEQTLSYPSTCADKRSQLLHDLVRLNLLKDVLYDGTDIYSDRTGDGLAISRAYHCNYFDGKRWIK